MKPARLQPSLFVSNPHHHSLTLFRPTSLLLTSSNQLTTSASTISPNYFLLSSLIRFLQSPPSTLRSCYPPHQRLRLPITRNRHSRPYLDKFYKRLGSALQALKEDYKENSTVDEEKEGRMTKPTAQRKHPSIEHYHPCRVNLAEEHNTSGGGSRRKDEDWSKPLST